MAIDVRDYAEFDKNLLANIKAGRHTAAALSIALEPEAKPLTNRPGEEFRVVDRRLQALRKKGVIGCERRGRDVVWSVTDRDMTQLRQLGVIAVKSRVLSGR